MTPLVVCGAGFLAAILWMDLMFDVQVRGHRGRELPEEVLTSIAGYYRRATTGAKPMSRLIAVVMLATLVAVGVGIAGGEGPAGWASLALAGAPIGLAAAHTVPNAVRLGARTGDLADQTRLARSIYRDHMFCLAAILSLVVLRLSA